MSQSFGRRRVCRRKFDDTISIQIGECTIRFITTSAAAGLLRASMRYQPQQPGEVKGEQ